MIVQSGARASHPTDLRVKRQLFVVAENSLSCRPPGGAQNVLINWYKNRI